MLIDKIEKNLNINPDIAIESCKSLIEGLCLKALSLLSDKYNSSKNLRKNCKNDLKVLTQVAFDEVYSNYVESQIHESLSNMLIDISVAQKIKNNAKRKVKEQAVKTIGQVSAIRNERGDISHGRNYPKDQESSIHLAKSINSITDGICSFMIEEIAIQYLTKLKEQDKLIYEDLLDFNEWLDKQHHIFSVKIDFSKLLYENVYEKYEEFYYMEYKDLFEMEGEDGEKDTATVEESDKIEVLQAELNKPVKDELEKVKAKNLVSVFSEDKFWTPEMEAQLNSFSQAENLSRENLKVVINDYLFTEKPPLREDVAKIMNIKPTLKDRAFEISELTTRIIAFASALKI